MTEGGRGRTRAGSRPVGERRKGRRRGVGNRLSLPEGTNCNQLASVGGVPTDLFSPGELSDRYGAAAGVGRSEEGGGDAIADGGWGNGPW